MGRLCYPTTAPGSPDSYRDLVLWPESCHGARRVWRAFCLPIAIGNGTNFIAYWRDRGTSLIGASKLSRYRIFVGGTCAESRYKLSGSQKLVTVLNLTYVQMSESGCKNHYESVMVADAKAKTVTSKLPQLTVLGAGSFN
jgi:hypothetical protein